MDKLSISIENNIIDVILIEDPTVIANRVSLVGLILRICKIGSIIVSFDPVKYCSARVIMHPRKYQCEKTVRHAKIQIKIRSGRLDEYKKKINTQEKIKTG